MYLPYRIFIYITPRLLYCNHSSHINTHEQQMRKDTSLFWASQALLIVGRDVIFLYTNAVCYGVYHIERQSIVDKRSSCVCAVRKQTLKVLGQYRGTRITHTCDCVIASFPFANAFFRERYWICGEYLQHQNWHCLFPPQRCTCGKHVISIQSSYTDRSLFVVRESVRNTYDCS